MFEKAAEEYYEDVTVGTFQECTENFADAVLTAYKDGADFGYNKANEWKYVKDGDLPKEDTAEKETLYLLWFGLDDYMTGLFSHGRFLCFDSGWFETNEVVAWKEIVLPKENE